MKHTDEHRKALRKLWLENAIEPAQNTVNASNRRIFEVMLSMLMSNGLTITLQLLMVPLLIWAWGPSLYGEWLILYTIPGYLSLSDFGIIASSNNKIEAQCARKNYISANSTYANSLVLLLTILSIIMGTMGILWAAWANQFTNLFSTLHKSELFWIAVCLILDMMITLLHRHHSALYRTLGRFNWTVNWQAIGRVFPTLCLCIGASLGASILEAAGMMLVTRLALFGLMLSDLNCKVAWLRLAWLRVNLSQVKSLAYTALGFMILPISNMIYLHVTTLLIAALYDPISVAAFSTMRTFTRMIPQFVGIAGRSRWSEISKANAIKDEGTIQNMRRHAIRQTMLLCAVGFFGYLLLGEAFYEFWTGGSLSFNKLLFLAFLCNSVLLACSYSLEVFLLAINQIGGYVKVFFFGTIIQITAGYFLSTTLGLAAFPIAGIFTMSAVLYYLFRRIHSLET